MEIELVLLRFQPIILKQYLCNIIAEGFFKIIFRLYILPFGLVRLRTFRLVHGIVRYIHWVQVSTLARGGCDNQRCYNKKKQIVNATGDVNDVMPGSAVDLGIWKKKAINWDLSLEEASRFSELAKSRPVGVYEMCRTWGGGSEGKVSLERNCVSLSPHVKKPSTQKGNKNFCTWTNFECFRIPICVILAHWSSG